jgi:acyl-lipid omega-6 desaturase (Delta-12 desaturase)
MATTEPIRSWSARDWTRAVAPFRQASAVRGSFELAVTFPPFVAVWTAMLIASRHGQFWISFALAPVAAGLLIRLFIIQHDCGHGSFFPSKLANDWVGRALGVLTVTPYDHWRRSHAIHHATSGNLDRRGIGDIKTLTVREYFDRNGRDRLRYWLYRHPLVMFGVGPAYVFLLENRVPVGFMRKGPMPWLSTMTTNAGILLVAGLLILCVGFTTFLVVHLPILLLAATMGVWVFYVQHQFEATTWDGAPDWRQPEAALHGSSHYDLPLVLRWFSANIGMHHVHHLSSGIPFYRLPEVLLAYPELRDVGRLTLWRSLVCVRLALWDEETRRLLSFREARAKLAASGWDEFHRPLDG